MADGKRQTFLRWLLDPQSLIGLSAVVISVAAVVVSAYEARIMRDWQRAAVWPYVQLTRSYYYGTEDRPAEERKWTLTLNARNVGVGPAQVRDFRVTVDGKAYPTWRAAMQALLGGAETVEYGQSSVNGVILPAGEDWPMFTLRESNLAPRIAELMDRLDFEACYCSVFEQCWRTSYQEFGKARAVESCAPSEPRFLE